MKTTDYNLNIYQPSGEHLCSTNGFSAGRMVVDLWRSVFTMNWQPMRGPLGRTEPSISEWLPK